MSARFGFWLLVGLIAAIGVGKAVQSDTLDPDLFWHLRVAEQLRTEGIHPLVDRISFESITQPWTPYSWLAELGMKWLWDHLGWRAAVAGEAVIVAGVIAMIALCCLALAGRDRRLNALIGTALGAFLTIPFISFRPITFAMLMLAVIAWLLLRDRTKRSKLVWLIVPLTMLLANVHLCAVLVPIWVACLLGGAIWERKDVKRYALLLAATSLTCLATPMLPGAARTAWYYQSRDVMVASPIIAEMQPVYHGVLGAVTVVLLIVLVAIAIVNRQRLRAGEWIWLIVGAILMLRLAKFTPMFALVAAPVLAATLPAMNDRALRKPVLALALAIVLLISLIRIGVDFPRAATAMDQWINRRGPSVEPYPTAAADYVQHNITPRTGRVINEFNWGGYLAWRLGDRYQVFLDGRTQLYPPDFWRATYLGDDRDAAKVIAAADADVAIIPVRKPRFGKALQMLGWRSVYRDEVAEVFLPPDH